MKMNILLLFFIIPVPVQATISSEWTYCQAASCAQKEQWKDMQKLVSSLLVDEPERPDFLYDAGVAAYKLKEFEKANAYFSSVVEQKKSEKALTQQSYFNLGNTKVALNQLNDAAAAYEKVLEINPEDQKARHNLDKVKEMIEQEKQQQEQKNKDKNEKQEQEKSEQQKNEEQKESSDSPEQQEKQSADEQQEGNQEDKAAHEPHDDQTDENKDQCSDDHASSSQNNENQQQQSAKKQDIKRDEKEQDMQAGQEHAGDFREEELSEIEKQLSPQDKWMAHALRQLEKAEEKEQKKMIQVQTSKQAVGENDQNCW